MARFTRILGLLTAVAVMGLCTLALGQDAQQETPQQTPAAPTTEAPASVQPAQDADTANEIQQLRAAIDQLQQQVNLLTSAVEALQAERVQSVKPVPESRNKGKAPASPKKSVAITPGPPVGATQDTDTPLTVLVFHDGHRTEARNYAIVGQTLWIYTEQESKKVPLTDLDVAATKNANSDRGITFQVPPGVK